MGVLPQLPQEIVYDLLVAIIVASCPIQHLWEAAAHLTGPSLLLANTTTIIMHRGPTLREACPSLILMRSPRKSSWGIPIVAVDQPSVVSEMGKTYVDAPHHHVPLADDEMPMDEAEDVMQRVTPAVLDGMRQQVEESQKEVERLTELLQKSQASRGGSGAVDAADRGGGVAAMADDDVSSLGDEDNAGPSSKLSKLIQGIEHSRKPPNLSVEEKALWDAYQTSLANVKVSSTQERRDLERLVQESASQLNSVRVREKILQEQLEETTLELQTLQTELKNLKENKDKSQDELQRLKATQAMALHRLEDQVAEMETKYKEANEIVEQQQEEHDRAICAIQRVLADVTSERDKAVEDLQAKLEAAESARAGGAPVPESAPVEGAAKRAFDLENEVGSLKKLLKTTESHRDTIQHDLDEKGGKIVILEQELNLVKGALEKAEEKADDLSKKLEEKSQIVLNLEGELASAKHQVEVLTKGEEELKAEVETKTTEIHTLRRRQRHMRLNEGEAKNREAPAAGGDVAALQEQLAETQSSLENAKKIILSLESANGNLATDLRGKLKEKDESVQVLQTEASERKRTLDSLATELRDLQRRKGEMDRMENYNRNLIRKQQVLALELESALNSLQEAAVVFESSMESGTTDSDAIDNISKILANTLGAVKYASMDIRDSPVPERTYSQDSSQADGASTPNSTRSELEERKLQVNRLEEALKQHREELDQMRRESNASELKREDTETKLRTEVLHLREQCKTNMEVLARKERELEVLRDSLDVEGDTGYISDDASSYGEEDAQALRRLNEAPMSPGAGSVYSHSQAEALATLMANGSGIEASMNASMSVTEVEKLRKELSRAATEREKAAKELKAERESLANAKMIISSLERANKSMMEDLRQRLQDSNTAIASLLDKSMQSEKLSTKLKAELDAERREREEQAEKHKAELQKYKDQGVEQAQKLAARDCEIQELLRAARQEDDASATSSTAGEEAAEETKQDS